MLSFVCAQVLDGISLDCLDTLLRVPPTDFFLRMLDQSYRRFSYGSFACGWLPALENGVQEFATFNDASTTQPPSGIVRIGAFDLVDSNSSLETSSRSANVALVSLSRSSM